MCWIIKITSKSLSTTIIMVILMDRPSVENYVRMIVENELLSYTNNKAWSSIDVSFRKDSTDLNLPKLIIVVRDLRVNGFLMDVSLELFMGKDREVNVVSLTDYLRKMIYYVMNTPYGLYYSSEVGNHEAQKAFYEWFKSKQFKYSILITGSLTKSVFNPVSSAQRPDFNIVEFIVSLFNKESGKEYWRVYTSNYGPKSSRTKVMVSFSDSFGKYIRGESTLMHQLMIDHVLRFADKLKMFNSYDMILRAILMKPEKVYSICNTSDRMIIDLLNDKLSKYGAGGLVRVITNIVYRNLIYKDSKLKAKGTPRFGMLADGKIVFTDMEGYISGLMTCDGLRSNALPATVTVPGVDSWISVFIAGYRMNWDDVLSVL